MNNISRKREIQFLMGAKTPLEKAELALDLVEKSKTINIHEQNGRIATLKGGIYLHKLEPESSKRLKILDESIKSAEVFLHRVHYHDTYICDPKTCKK